VVVAGEGDMRQGGRALGVLVFLAGGLSGCLSTHRVEDHRVVNAGLNADGTSSCCSQSSREERQWHGLWLGQPDRIRP
jgi:hypothetical protein